MANRRVWYIVGVLLAATAMLIAVASREQLGEGNLNVQRLAAKSEPVRQSPARGSLAVRTTTVERGNIAQTLSYTGDVKARDKVTVVPKLAGSIEALTVDVGDRVEAGQMLALLEHDVADAQVDQARAGVAAARARLAGLQDGARAETVGQAEANVRLAEARLTALRDGPRAETVGQGEASVRLAEAKLAALKAGPTKAQMDAAEATLRAAKNQLYAVEAQADSYLARMGTGYTPDMKEAQAGLAHEQIRQAEAQLAAVIAPPTQEQVDQAEAAIEAARHQLQLARNPYTDTDVAQAEAAVDAARQQLLLAQNPYTKNDLEAARAAVAQAEAGLRLASLQQKNALVEAPIAGVVSERWVSKGDMASPAAPMLTILGEGMEVQIAVEEAVISQVVPGKSVSLSVAAYPGVILSGQVASVAPSLDPRTRASVVKVQVDDTQSRLKPGMFVQATIVTASSENVFLLPKRAVVERNQRQAVFVADGGFAKLREVRTGLTDGKNVEIADGLKDTDSVILTSLSDLADGDPVRAEASGR